MDCPGASQLQGLSVGGGHSPGVVGRLLSAVASLEECRVQAVQSPELRLTGLVFPWHMGSPWARDRTCVFLHWQATFYTRATSEAL